MKYTKNKKLGLFEGSDKLDYREINKNMEILDASVAVAIGKTEPTENDILWFNTQKTYETGEKTVELKLGDATENSLITVMANNNEYEVLNAKNLEKLPDGSYSFDIKG